MLEDTQEDLVSRISELEDRFPPATTSAGAPSQQPAVECGFIFAWSTFFLIIAATIFAS